MRIQETFLKCVVFIGTKVNEVFSPMGTGFVVGVVQDGHTFQHIVTARHVIDWIALENVHVRVNSANGKTITFPTSKKDWAFHPADKFGDFVDVAVMPTKIRATDFDYLMLPIEEMMVTEAIVQDQDIGIGDDIFYTGLFTNHFGDAKNVPIVRFGNISAVSDEPFKTQYGYIHGYLVETHSIGGSSGSPVFVSIPPLKVSNGVIKASQKKTSYFLGLLCGTWTVENPNDAVSDTDEKEVTPRSVTGISIVVPADRIIEAINHPDLKRARADILERIKQK